MPIGEPLENEIISQGHEVMWFADEENGKYAIAHKKNVFSSIKKAIDYNPNIVLTSTNNVAYFLSGIKVQIFHGIFSQKRPTTTGTFAFYRIRGFFDLYCTHGPSTTKIFEELSKEYPHFVVKETGFCKVDPLFPLENKSETKKPVVLISSTFTTSKSLALNLNVFTKIKSLSESGKYIFMMVLHPKLSDEVRQKWHSITSKNFKFYDTTDLIPLFKKSDIMLSDTTSAIQEFLLQNKPVVSINHTFKHNYIIHVNEIEHLEKDLDFALTYPKEIIENIKMFVKKLHPYYDGESSRRVINASIELLENYPPEIAKKPLNLIRKFKMRKKLNYWKL